MNYPSLSEMYEILNWHYTKRDKKPGESVGLFIVLPKEIAEQFPKDGREGEDSSPQHSTLCFIGNLSETWEPKFLEVVKNVCSQFKPFRVKLGKTGVFDNQKGQKILHSTLKGKKLFNFHDALKFYLQQHQFPVDATYGTYKPHSTIKYANSEEELENYKDIRPEGEFVVDKIWVWGTSQPHMIFLGKQ